MNKDGICEMDTLGPSSMDIPIELWQLIISRSSCHVRLVNKSFNQMWLRSRKCVFDKWLSNREIDKHHAEVQERREIPNCMGRFIAENVYGPPMAMSVQDIGICMCTITVWGLFDSHNAKFIQHVVACVYYPMVHNLHDPKNKPSIPSFDQMPRSPPYGWENIFAYAKEVMGILPLGTFDTSKFQPTPYIIVFPADNQTFVENKSSYGMTYELTGE
jgi:hypothetical protein